MVAQAVVAVLQQRIMDKGARGQGKVRSHDATAPKPSGPASFIARPPISSSRVSGGSIYYLTALVEELASGAYECSPIIPLQKPIIMKNAESFTLSGPGHLLGVAGMGRRAALDRRLAALF
jgi:hypothetical protein